MVICLGIWILQDIKSDKINKKEKHLMYHGVRNTWIFTSENT